MNMTLKIMEDDKMEKFEARKPDYKGDGVAAWIELDKNGNKYLNIHVLGGQKKGGLTLVAFENKDVPELEQNPKEPSKLGKDW